MKRNILNFNPAQRDTNEPILDSPLSLEACKRQGINPKELLMKTLAEVKS